MIKRGGKVAVCSFIGSHEVYDKNIYSKVHAAVNSLAAENDEAEFLFYRMDSFISLCLRAALEAKSRFPQKVTIALVLDESNYKRFRLQDAGSIPFCMVDKVILPPLTVPEGNDHTRIVKKTQRWMIQNSTHVICYLYRQFYRAENHLLDYAKKSPTLNIIDLTDKDTEDAICGDVRFLSEREQEIIRLIEAGYTQSEVKGLLGLSRPRISQILSGAGMILQKYSRERLTEEASSDGEPHPVVCSIFAIENFTHKLVSSFLFTVLFLSRVYGPIHFDIEENNEHSNILEVLKLLAELIAISNIRNYHSHVVRSVGKMISALYQTFNKEQPLREKDKIAKIIKYSDFCICNLTSSPIADEISNVAAKTGKAILLDIGKAYPKVERPLS